MDDMIGKRFGRWTVLRRDGTDKRKRKTYLCVCECGSEKVIAGTYLRYGSTKSCGCLSVDTARNLWTKHGLYKHPLHSVWRQMKKRCSKESYPVFDHYGGRGISVCEEWKDSFESFYSWAVNNGYKVGLEIDRKDNSNGYFPENCRFVDHATNCRNTRQSRLWFVNGEKYKSASQAAIAIGVSRETIRRWCGVSSNNGKLPTCKNGCHSEMKYND